MAEINSLEELKWRLFLKKWSRGFRKGDGKGL
jgi:hypothetical protein